MIKPGLCSVSFRQKTPDEIIDLTKKSGLTAIEWASDAHAHEGDVALAKEIRKKTEDAGLEVSSYGSYYALGSKQDVVPFLQTAEALGAKEMRIWAGSAPSAYYLPDARAALVREAKEAARLAKEFGVSISTECHAHTLTDFSDSLLKLLEEVDADNFKTYWQPLLHFLPEEHPTELARVHSSGKLTNLHVYQFKLFEGEREQLLLSEGYKPWSEFFSFLSKDKEERYALLEFVREGKDESLLADAKTLIELCEKSNNM